jgi:hypothetical protein
MNLNRSQLKQLMFGMRPAQQMSMRSGFTHTAANQAQAVSPPEPQPIEPTPVTPSDPVDPEQPSKPLHQPSDPTEPTHPHIQPGYLNTPAIGNDEDNTLFDSSRNFENIQLPDSMKFFIVS